MRVFWLAIYIFTFPQHLEWFRLARILLANIFVMQYKYIYFYLYIYKYTNKLINKNIFDILFFIVMLQMNKHLIILRKEIENICWTKREWNIFWYITKKYIVDGIRKEAFAFINCVIFDKFEKLFLKFCHYKGDCFPYTINWLSPFEKRTKELSPVHDIYIHYRIFGENRKTLIHLLTWSISEKLIHNISASNRIKNSKTTITKKKIKLILYLWCIK